jgi:LuxR family maltose regulon positive regulatory protein
MLSDRVSTRRVDESSGMVEGDRLTVSARPVLDAKVTVQPARPGMVVREQLVDRLLDSRDQRVVWIAAPPGYGKTTLLSQWADRERRPVAWLSLDRSDEDATVFLSDVIAAFEGVGSIDPQLTPSLVASASPVPELAVIRLAAVLAGAPEPTLLVIDDAHLISDRGAWNVLVGLTDHLPSAVQVAIATRDGQDAHLARLRAQDALAELGPADLAFNEVETAELLRNIGRHAEPAEIERLVERSEGWPAALYLAARSRGLDRVDSEDRALTVSGRDRTVADYIRYELLAPHSPADLEFMARTAIVERMTGSLCDAVIDGTGSHARLARLSGADQFVVPIDRAGEWYRYHTLLREYLLGELERSHSEEVEALHRHAAAWFADRGQAAAAVDHALAGGDLADAARALGRYAATIFDQGRATTAASWFDGLDEARLLRVPYLALFAAWFYVLRGDATRARRFADAAERAEFEGRPPDGTTSFESGRAMLRALMARRGLDEALRHAELAASLEVPPGPWRTVALTLLGGILAVSGSPRAEGILAEVATTHAERTDVNARLVALAWRALLTIERADWSAAERLADACRAAMQEPVAPTDWAAASAQVVHARVALHHGDIEAGKASLARLLVSRVALTSGTPWYSVRVLLEIARCYLLVSDPAGARAALAEADRILVRYPDLGRLPGEVADARRRIAALPVGISGVSTLTPAELRLLSYLPTYLSFAEIADRLFVSVNTIRTQAKAVYGKLDATSRSEAVEHAIEAGLLEPLSIDTTGNISRTM